MKSVAYRTMVMSHLDHVVHTSCMMHMACCQLA